MTVVEQRQRCPEHGIPDCSPLLNGCTWRPLSPYELAREQYARQLVDDIADTMLTHLSSVDPDTATPIADYIGGMAVAVVRLVYPTLAEMRDRDDLQTLLVDASGVMQRWNIDVEKLPGHVHRLVASMLRDIRRLFDDAQNVREQYGESARQAYDERDQAQRDAADAVDAVRRVKRTLRPITSSTDCDELLAAVYAARRIVRHVRVGREP